MFLTISNKREIADKQETSEINNIFYNCWKMSRSLSYPLSGKRVSKNPNLPIDDRRKIKLSYE